MESPQSAQLPSSSAASAPPDEPSAPSPEWNAAEDDLNEEFVNEKQEEEDPVEAMRLTDPSMLRGRRGWGLPDLPDDPAARQRRLALARVVAVVVGFLAVIAAFAAWQASPWR